MERLCKRRDELEGCYSVGRTPPELSGLISKNSNDSASDPCINACGACGQMQLSDFAPRLSKNGEPWFMQNGRRIYWGGLKV
jgi:hypothetical protein